MTDVPTSIYDTAPIISAKDEDVQDLFSEEFLELYEVHSYRNAARILSAACPDEFNEVINKLMEFRIQTEDLVRSGGNKSRIAMKVEDLLNPLGWHETRIQGDILIKQTVHEKEKVLGPFCKVVAD